MSTGAHRLDAIEAHQPSNAALADIKACLFKFHGHPRRTIGAKAHAVLLPDMGQHLHIGACAVGYRAIVPRTIAACTDTQHAADHLDWPDVTPALHAKVFPARTSRPLAREELRSFFKDLPLLLEHAVLKAKALVLAGQICLRR